MVRTDLWTMAMKRNMRLLMGVVLICGLWMFVACASNDSPVVVPDTEQLQDGVWTGSGEGRSGTIIVKVTVENHQVTKVTVVSQSESTFAQETINSLCENAVGRYRSQWSLGGYCCCLLRQTI